MSQTGQIWRCFSISLFSLDSVFLFHGLSEEQLQEADRYLSPPVLYKKGDLIYDTHNFQKALGIVISGNITVCPPQGNGQPLILNRLHVGDVFGAAALFDATASDYVTELTAATAVSVRYISQEKMIELLTAFPRITQNYIVFLTGRIRFLNRKFAALTGGNAMRRLYEYCLSHQSDDGIIRFPASMTELAHVLNMGRSSLYRALDTLIDEGIVSKSGKEYTLMKEGLL